jgi:hypothetical protein
VKGFFKKITEGFRKTREVVTEQIVQVFTQAKAIDDAFYDDLEAVLLRGDVGPGAAWLFAKTGSWSKVFWAMIICDLIAAFMALLWLKPLAAKVVRRSEGVAADAEEEAQQVLAQARALPVPVPKVWGPAWQPGPLLLFQA